MEDVQYWVAFDRIPGLGRVKFSLLEGHFGRLQEAWRASSTDLKAAGLDSRSVQAIVTRRPTIDPDQEMQRLAGHDVRPLTSHADGYPKRLKEIYDPPPVLYLRGTLLPQDEWSITVVGTRQCTDYGQRATEHIVTELARNGITIVSGLARGIDTVAHRASLQGGGRTLAVLAGGLDTVYPWENLPLSQQILGSGALLTEQPIGVKPRAEFFPRRNRIMSGLSLGTLVIEAGKTSGALITAGQALEQGRDVFGVPGSIFSPASDGVHRLIQDGAKPVLSAKDIMEELNLAMVAHQMEMRSLVAPDETEELLLKYLAAEPTHIDEIRRQSGLPIALVSSTLAMMELKGLARQVGAMSYVQGKEASESYRIRVE